MRHGSTVMILRQSNSLKNGGTVVPPGQKRSECKGWHRSKWQQFFGVRREFCWWTTSNRVQPSMQNITVLYWWRWGKTSRKKLREALQRCHPVAWQCLITHCRWNNGKTDFLRVSSDALSTLFSWPGSFWLSSVPHTQKTPKWTMIWKCSGGN